MADRVTVRCGDCRRIVPTLGTFDFVFADPGTFTTRQAIGDDPASSLDEYTRQWLRVCWRACRGVLAVHGDDDVTESVIVAARRLRMPRVGWIQWAYRPRPSGTRGWADARQHCVIYARDPMSHTWNTDTLSMKTALGRVKTIGNVWGRDVDGPQWGTVAGNNGERWERAADQLPERYLARLILAYTNPRDRVLDPFAGSGTAAVVAYELGRQCVAIDRSSKAVASIRRRLRFGAFREIEPVTDWAS